MDDAFVMRGGHAAGDLHGEIRGLRCGQRPARDSVAQRLALEQLRHHVGHVALDVHVEDRDDVGVVERGGGLGFLRESRQTIGIAREPGGSTLTATWRFSRVSRARYTSPMAPAPMGATIS